MTDQEPILDVRDLHSFYGESHILHGVDFQVGKGEVVALLGRNGSGRSTTLRSLMGLTDKRSGSIRIDGKESIRMPSHKIAKLGVGYCPEERGIFAGLSCHENLLLLPTLGEVGMHLNDIDSMFPNLRERAESPGSRLSGGEQQMLAIARILRAGASILLLDEISEGLAPVIVKALSKLIRKLKEQGITMVLVEQNFRFAAPLADRFYIIEHGQVVETFSADQLEEKSDIVHDLLGV